MKLVMTLIWVDFLSGLITIAVEKHEVIEISGKE
jgi:hypothetical protein